MRFRKWIWLFFFICFLLGCNTIKDSQAGQKKFVFKKKKSYVFQLDSTAVLPVMVGHTQVFKEKYMTFLSPADHSLYFYDLATQKKVKKIILEKEGENGVGNISQHLIHSEDSIFVVNSYAYRCYLLDGLGKIRTAYKLMNQQKYDENTSLVEPFPYNNPIVHLNNELYFSGAPDANPLKKSYYDLKTLTIRLNLRDHSLRYSHGFPPLFKEKYFTIFHKFHSRVYLPEKEGFVYTFFADPQLHLMDKEGKIIDSYDAELTSEKINIVAYNQPLENGDISNKLFNEQGSYSYIFYDPYREKIYRSAANRQILADKTEKVARYWIILDNNFKKLGELSFQAPVNITVNGRYNSGHIHAIKDGILIHKITDNQNQLQYDLVDIVEEE